jgi:hypothetical protein
MLHCFPFSFPRCDFQFFWKFSAPTSLHDQRTTIKSNDLSIALNNSVWPASLVDNRFRTKWANRPTSKIPEPPFCLTCRNRPRARLELDHGKCQWNNTTPMPSKQLVCCELTPLPVIFSMQGLAPIGHHAFHVAAQAINKNRCIKLAGM